MYLSIIDVMKLKRREMLYSLKYNRCNEIREVRDVVRTYFTRS